MVVKRFFEEGLAQTSYLIGCGTARRAIVIDPNRDADRYMRAAADEGVQITDVTETHIHADFVSGSRELAARTGATLHLSDEGDAAWKYDFAHEGRLLKHGDRIEVGNVLVEALHTPGHTPEHLSFAITDRAAASAPIAVATGDFIFVGDVGRPDLLERAVHVKDSMADGARTLYRALRAFEGAHHYGLHLGPGHGAGRPWGMGFCAVPHTTLGYERRFNWAFAVADEAAFVAQVLEGQPDPPGYFATMKRVNKAGPALVGAFAPPARLDASRLVAVLAAGGLVVDTRPAEAYAAAHLPGTINIPFNRAFITWAGWLIASDRPFAVIVDDGDPERPAAVSRALALIGLENLEGYVGAGALASEPALPPLVSTRQMDVPALVRALDGAEVRLLDVRTDLEWQHGHVPDALHIPLGHLAERLADVPRDRPLVVHCQTGARSAIAASLLERAGLKGVRDLRGGYVAWSSTVSP
jgi:hydroxyacylglutathione hydrolase